MKNFILILSFSLVTLILALFLLLGTVGYETDKFNTIISKEINKNYPKAKIELQKVKIKIDFKRIDLFLSTESPNISFSNIYLPISDLKIYLNLMSFLKTKPKTEKIIFSSKELEISKIQKLILGIKPSNFKSFVLNNLSKGSIKGVINLDFGENFEIVNYKAKGVLKKTKIRFSKKYQITDTSFNFIVDPDLVLINSINSNFLEIPIKNGSIDIKREKEIKISGSINVVLNSDKEKIQKILNKFIKFDFQKNQTEITGNFTNNFSLKLSESLEITDYSYNLSGTINSLELKFDQNKKNNLFQKEIKTLNFKDSKVQLKLKKNKKNNFNSNGKYLINKKNNYENFDLKSYFSEKKSSLILNFDLGEKINIKAINYKKNITDSANIQSEIYFSKNKIDIKSLKFTEGKNIIQFENLIIENKKMRRFDRIKIQTFIDNIKNNDFEIIYGKKIKIRGDRYDATNLIEQISSDEKKINLENFTKDIEINFKEISTKLSIPLNNFNLIGKIENGKFTKISSKSEFSDKRYLDISLKKAINSKQKILEIYSDYPKPILADFNFFKGIEGGNLLFSSVFDDVNSSSNLVIEDFQVINAPAFAKLLSLADLGGIADLLSGSGISFDKLEIKFSDDQKVKRITEIYAVGPSISILMEGYIERDTKLTSLRGTMVPAKELNKLISKIPVLGEILIGKEVGEGIFGVSFKMKGLPGEIKTTVNPIKTLTPRFITRALEKRKKNN